jgi:HlyD family secretion protein
MPAPARERNRSQADRNRQQLWTLIDGKPGPVMVTIGFTDGLMTQVIDGDITPGMELIVDAESLK